MTINEARHRIKEIQRLADEGDSEAAHSREDRLHQDVLRAIVDGVDDAPEFAALALSTLSIDFERWCA